MRVALYAIGTPLMVALSLAACSTAPAPSMDASKCSYIQGMIGREFRFSAHGAAQAPGVQGKAGFKVGWTLPDVTREFRETLIMGDHLCHAASAGLIKPSIYEDYIARQVGGVRVLQIQAGDMTLEQVRASNEEVARFLTALGDHRALEGFSTARFLQGADPSQGNEEAPFAPAQQVASSVIERIPANYPDATEFAVEELRGRIDGLTTELGALKARRARLESETLGHVLFELNSTDLDETARRELAAIVSAVGHDAKVEVEGFADTSGSYADNTELSRRRAEVVASFLRSLGVKSGVGTIAFGRTDAYGSDPHENRRVIIRRVSIEP